MRMVILLLLFIGALGLPSKGQCPLSSAVVVDGKADEWNMNWETDEEKNFSYNVCADDQNLYVRVKTGEFFTKRKMGAFGFTLWFDPSGKKKRKYGLKFPAAGAEADERIAKLNKEGENAGRSLGERTDFQKHADREMIANLEILEIIGLTDEPLTSTRSGITNGIKVAIDMDETGAYIYEAVIPFKAYRLTRANLAQLAVGFETGKYALPKQKPTTKNSPVGADLSPSQLSRMQGYDNMQGNPKLIYPTTSWTRIVLNK
jgi:hypothetical protein